MIYLDNSSSTQMHREVVSVMHSIMNDIYANPASLHTLGIQAERVNIEAREIIARELSASPDEIIFTSGGTEANNLAIQGVAKRFANRGKHIITTSIEHASVFEVFQMLEAQGFRATYLPVQKSGEIDLTELEKALCSDTILVSIHHVNNELGVVQPIGEISRLLRNKSRKILFHVDAVQSFAKIPLKPKENGIDLLTISGHKIHGPKGVGVLYKKKNLDLSPLLYGGPQEYNFRPGTSSLANVAGMAKATQITVQHRDTFLNECEQWRQIILSGLEELESGWHLNNSLSISVPYILNISFDNIKSETLVHALAEEGVIVSSQSACSSKLEAPSRIILALGTGEKRALSSIRISMGQYNTSQEIEQATKIIKRVVCELKKIRG